MYPQFQNRGAIFVKKLIIVLLYINELLTLHFYNVNLISGEILDKKLC